MVKRIRWSYMINTTISDDMATDGTRKSAVMILIWFLWNISVLSPRRSTVHYGTVFQWISGCRWKHWIDAMHYKLYDHLHTLQQSHTWLLSSEITVKIVVYSRVMHLNKSYFSILRYFFLKLPPGMPHSSGMSMSHEIKFESLTGV